MISKRQRKRGGEIKDIANYIIALFMFVYLLFVALSFGRIAGYEPLIKIWSIIA